MNTKTSSNNDNDELDNTSKRGFASMDPKKQREIASEGGRAAHKSDSDEAGETTRKGHAQEKNQLKEQHSSSAHRGKSNGNNDNEDEDNKSSSSRGGSSQQHAKAGSQSHKNK